MKLNPKHLAAAALTGALAIGGAAVAGAQEDPATTEDPAVTEDGTTTEDPDTEDGCERGGGRGPRPDADGGATTPDTSSL